MEILSKDTLNLTERSDGTFGFNKNEALLTEGGEGLTFQIWLSSFQCFYEKNENTVRAVLLVTSTFISNL